MNPWAAQEAFEKFWQSLPEGYANVGSAAREVYREAFMRAVVSDGA